MGVMTNLAECFEMEETSGNAIGSIASSAAVETGGPIASTTGKVNLCRDLERDNTQYFTIADNALFSLGTDTAMALAGWIKLETKTGNNHPIASKYNSGAGNSREYALDFDVASDRFRFFISADNSTVHVATANGFGSPSLATWYFVIGWHDPAADKIYVSVNNQATPDETAHSTGTRDGTAAFEIGTANFAARHVTDGLIDQVLFYKGGFPDAADIKALYNNGNGLSLAQMKKTFQGLNINQTVKRAAYY